MNYESAYERKWNSCSVKKTFQASILHVYFAPLVTVSGSLVVRPLGSTIFLCNLDSVLVAQLSVDETLLAGVVI